MISEYITPKQIAEIIPLSYRHIADRVTHRKDFPKPYRIANRRYYKKDEILQWWEGRKQ